MSGQFWFNRVDDECLEIFLNDRSVGFYHHDSDGWKTMERVENTVKSIAKILNIPITETFGEE